MNIHTAREIIIEKSKHDPKEVKEAKHRLDIDKANKIYQQTKKYKDAKKVYRKNVILKRINKYVSKYGQKTQNEYTNQDISNDFDELDEPLEYKRLFVKLFGNDEYMKYIAFSSKTPIR